MDDSIQQQITELEQGIAAYRHDLHLLQALNFKVSHNSISTKETKQAQNQAAELDDILNKLNDI